MTAHPDSHSRTMAVEQAGVVLYSEKRQNRKLGFRMRFVVTIDNMEITIVR